MMNSSMSAKSAVGALFAALFVAAAAGQSGAQQKAPARGNHHRAPKVPAGKHHTLAATLETVQWGWLDPREKAKLTINSGDTVSIRDYDALHDKISARHDDGAGRRAAQSKSWRRPASTT